MSMTSDPVTGIVTLKLRLWPVRVWNAYRGFRRLGVSVWKALDRAFVLARRAA